MSKKEAFIANLMQLSVADFNAQHQQHREEALKALQHMEFPTLRDEAWKYTRIASVLNNSYAPIEPSEEVLSAVDTSLMAEYRMVFVDGFYQASLSNLPLRKGLHVSTIGQAKIENPELIDLYYNQLAQNKSDIFSALNTGFHHTGAVVEFAENTVLNEAVEIYFVTQSENSVAQPRNLFVAQKGAQGSIHVHYTGSNATAFCNPLNEVFVASNSHLEVEVIQNQGNATSMVHSTQVQQEQDSTFTTGAFTFGGKLVRNNLNILVNGEHCETHLNGAYILNEKQHVDNHTVVDHLKANCQSNENYKGIMDDKSTGVFNGKVFVRQDAQKIEAFQSNQNILLTEHASVNSKPELEIYADDVKCSHGSTTGQLDEDALFYLMARGIPEKTAIKLLVTAFVADALEEIKSEELRAQIEELVQSKLNK